ncbi:MAG TPA: protein translocase subunit SecD [Tepidisphaeraceae bacterium]|jgi:SecD/SecF fusion protein|nr:protein translocase subunit SecD [Tepidisphaeraceae bacterium]
MHEHNGLRLTFSLAVLLGAIGLVFSPVLDKIFHPHDQITQWVKLNPGIDMVGGTSLVYEIKKSDTTKLDGKLASEVADVLKKRVDPKGVKNLIWRPQGDTRLEIQMPLSPDAKNSAEVRRELGEKMIAAADALKKTNVDADAVADAIEGKNGKTQADLAKLAGDDKTRQKLFAELTDLWGRIQKAHDARDAQTEAKLKIEFEQKLHPKSATEGEPEASPIDQTNLTKEQLDGALTATDTTIPDLDDARQDAANTAEQNREIADLKKKFADFPSRLRAIDEYVAAARKLSSSKDSLDDATDLKRLLKGAGVLQYNILCVYYGNNGELTYDMPRATYEKYVAQLKADGPRVHAGNEAQWFAVSAKSKLGAPTVDYNKKRYVLGFITPGPDGKPRSLDQHMPKPWHLIDAKPEREMSGESVVGFSFDPQGAEYFGELTQANLKKPMAIVLDNNVISAPTINGRIGASGEIDGGSKGFSEDELSYLVSTLKGGSLPASLSDEPISERTVGPQLGQDNLKAGLIACFLGLVVVAVFLCAYYFLAGVVATFAVIMNVLLVLAVMAAFGATFTLPSIAGIILSVGTAVDANVLIFERLREEQHRGLSLRLALRNAYGKAFSAILDSNMTTFITSLFLIFFGSEEVKGFGYTLIIGIVASLFTALFVTRTIFNVLIEHFGVTHLRSIPLVFPKLDKALRPNWDWMGKAWIFIAFSAIGITVGLTLFFIQVKAGHMMGIEFASGTSVQFELAQPMKQADLRELIEKRISEKKADAAELPAFSVVTVGNDAKTYEFTTLNSDAVHVRSALLHALVDDKGKTLLKIDVPSKFEGIGKPLATLINKNVIPLEDKQTPAASKWPQGFRPEDVKDYEPGVAVVLDHLDPPLTPAQIIDRIRQQQLQLPTGSVEASLDIAVESPLHNAEAATSTAVVLCRGESLPYSKDPAKWQEALAAPLWQLVNESINREAQLQQVKTFDKQVAGEAARDALLALVFSILVIMAYIWFRFGNLKYGTATMAALVHDVFFTVAALGFAHYLFDVPVIGKVLQLEQFRIDLTVVAGILTIMGYSMIDTIVVFDRIRENRGKFGTVSRKVINDAINQTLSRTLLTAGTNVVTVAIMYFLGGPGIHGFTFVLLFGILVGTYSSVAIAAPILLLGKQEEVPSHARGQVKTAGA